MYLISNKETCYVLLTSEEYRNMFFYVLGYLLERWCKPIEDKHIDRLMDGLNISVDEGIHGEDCGASYCYSAVLEGQWLALQYRLPMVRVPVGRRTFIKYVMCVI